MKPQHTDNDNLYLRGYAAWQTHSLNLLSRLLLLITLPMLALLAGILWLGLVTLPAEQARQADAVGQQLSRQLASTLAEPMKAGDHLSLNLQLAQWQQNPLIAHASISNSDKRVIAEAGQRPASSHRAPGQVRHDAQITVQGTDLGQLHLSLAADPWQRAPDLSLGNLLQLWFLAWLAGLLLAWKLAGRQRQLLLQLGHWDPAQGTAPGLQRRDEFGRLAQQLNQRFGPAEPEPVPQPEPEPVQEPATAPQSEQPDTTGEQPTDDDTLTTQADAGDADTTTHVDIVEASDKVELTQQTDATEPKDHAPFSVTDTALLCVRIGNQDALRRLPRERLLALLERYRSHLERAGHLYRGEQHTLHDGTAVLLFHAASCNQDEITHALCCGELLRVLAHDLQIEIADTGVTLNLQLVLGHGSGPKNQPEQPLEQHAQLQACLENLQHSRNLLLLDSELAGSSLVSQRAATRRLASQPGVHCVERLREPWQSALERQINQLYRERRG